MNLVGNPAPDFELQGYFRGQFVKYKLSDYRDKWVILLFYPLDFTFVCPTEVLNFSSWAKELAQLNCQIFGISVDSAYVHKAWVDTKREDGGLGGELNFPLLSDLNKATAREYDILTGNDGVALRGLFLISPEGIVMHATINNLSVGRSTSEAMRVLKAFQFVSTNKGHVCPADWEEGKDSMVASPDGMKKYLAKPLAATKVEVIEMYRQIMEMATKEKDITTTFIFKEILEDEEEHHDLFTSML